MHIMFIVSGQREIPKDKGPGGLPIASFVCNGSHPLSFDQPAVARAGIHDSIFDILSPQDLPVPSSPTAKSDSDPPWTSLSLSPLGPTRGPESLDRLATASLVEPPVEGLSLSGLGARPSLAL